MDTPDDSDVARVAAELASAWTVSRLAEALGVTHRTALRYARRLPHYRRGGSVLISDAVAREYIRGLARDPEAASA